MPAITATAPGKTILFGEHAVVYGRPAIAVPVNQVQARATVYPEIKAPPGSIRILAPDIQLESNLADLPADHPFLLAFQAVQQYLAVDRFPAFSLKVTSTIPIAAGLGSSAAVSIAIIRSLSGFLGAHLSDEEISQLAYRVEQRQHGNPSGIDNTVVTYARPIVFTRGQPFEILEIAEPMALVIADTGIQSSTAETVGDVRRMWQAEPDRYELLFDQVGEVVQRAREIIRRGPIQALGPLMLENHRLLQEIRVSSTELDLLVDAARQAGAMGAKLSGGGRGGNMIALVAPETAEAVSQALLAAGAVRTLTTVIHPSG